MKRMSIGIKYIMIFTIVIFLWVTVSTRMSLKEFKAENYPRAASGTIDFSKWNFDRQEPTNIDGEWQVYNGQFLSLKEILEKPEKDLKYGTVPMNWNSYDEDSAGFATYMLSIEGLEDEVTYGISIQRVFTSYRLWINGKPVAQVGEISADREHWLGKVKPQLVFVQPKNGKVEMIFHVSGFDYYKGGILDSMQIGSQMQMTEQFNERMMLDSFLAGIILIMAIYHVMRYLFRKKDKENLYFGIFAFLVFLETIFEGQMIYSRVFSAIEFRFEENLQSIVLFLMLPSLASYVYYFFEKKINKKIINCIWAVGLAFSIAIIMSPMSAVGVIWRIFEIIIILVLVYLLYFLVDIAKSNDNQAAVMLAGFSVFTITAVHDVLVELEIFPTPYILPFGLVLLLLSQILMISMKYAGSFEQIESLTEDLVDSNKKLKKSNVEMEKRIQERTRALAESENRYRQLFDAPFEGIVVIDEKGVTIEVNKELCNMTGYDKSEVIGKNALEFIDPAYHEIAM